MVEYRSNFHGCIYSLQISAPIYASIKSILAILFEFFVRGHCCFTIKKNLQKIEICNSKNESSWHCKSCKRVDLVGLL